MEQRLPGRQRLRRCPGQQTQVREDVSDDRRFCAAGLVRWAKKWRGPQYVLPEPRRPPEKRAHFNFTRRRDTVSSPGIQVDLPAAISASLRSASRDHASSHSGFGSRLASSLSSKRDRSAGGRPQRRRQTVVIALDVGHDAPVLRDAGAAVLRPGVGGLLPLRLPHFVVPRQQRLLRIAVSTPERRRASKRWCAGATRHAAWCRRRSSSAWPSRAA